MERLQESNTEFKDINPGIISQPYPSVGVGSGWVYCYYFPYIRTLKEKSGNRRWPCKIGKTVGDVQNRISQQLKQTGVFEPPEVGFRAQTDDPSGLEKAMHDKLRHRHLEHPGIGTEWFETNLVEVRWAYLEIIYPKWHQLPRRWVEFARMGKR